MNTLEGKIAEISTSGKLSIVKVLVQGTMMSAIIIDTPETSDYLIIGNTITVIFKETEVIIGIGRNIDVSLRNKIEGQISHIMTDKLLSKIIIDTSAGSITSIITTHAVRQLGLEVGHSVTAMIKTNEIMLSN